MSDSFVNLKCPGCGAKLEVYGDMERFACGYCGNEVLVQRRGGTVSLKAVVEGIREVQKGTDRTAAELALVRLDKELQALRDQRPMIEQEIADELKSNSGRVNLWETAAVIGFLFALLGGLTLNPLLAGLGLAVLVVSYRPVHKAWDRRRAGRDDAEQTRLRRMQEFDAKIASKEAELAQTRQVLDAK